MWSIYNKELSHFFSSLIGYLVIGFFLLILGLMLWVFPDYSILEYPFASLDPLFDLAPTVLLILVPAITMRSFAEEKSSGTIEILFTKPISLWQLVWGKYLANLSLILFALLPTLLYLVTIINLAASPESIDRGTMLSAYLGLVFLAAVFCALGIFASSITQNQIVAFLMGILLCFLFYWAFLMLSKISFFVGGWDFVIQQLGVDYHYESMSRGVLDSRNVIYFLSVIALCIYLSKVSLERQ